MRKNRRLLAASVAAGTPERSRARQLAKQRGAAVFDHVERVLEIFFPAVIRIGNEPGARKFPRAQIRETVKKTYVETGYLLDPHGACGYRALEEGLKPGETGVFLETAHPAKFRDTIERILGQKIAIPEKLTTFMAGKKQSVPMTKDFGDFKKFLLSQRYIVFLLIIAESDTFRISGSAFLLNF